MSILHMRRAVLVAALASVAAVLSMASPPAAHADRCQPEELVDVQPLTAEDANPVCIVMLDVVYPGLSCDSTMLSRCVETLNVSATAANAPATAAATPGRALGAVSKMPTATKRLIFGDPPSCTIGLSPELTDLPSLGYYYYCVIGEPF